MKHLKKFNEVRNFSEEDLELMKTHMDDETIEHVDHIYDKVKNNIDEFVDAVSGELEDYTIQVSAEVTFKDTINTEFGKYEYVVTLRKIE